MESKWTVNGFSHLLLSPKATFIKKLISNYILYICIMTFEKHHALKTILMKVTSRERHQILQNTIFKYIELANDLDNMVWLFTCDEDDQDTVLMCNQLNLKNKHVIVGTSNNKIHAINRDVDLIQNWDILLNISDDQLPVVKGYDDMIRQNMPNDLDASLWFSDGWQPRINTQEILGRAYYDRLGYIYYPEYKSFFCDNESTEVAKRLNKLVISNKCIIKHFHPGWDANSHIKQDSLYARNNHNWQHDEGLFNYRESINFGL